MFRQTLTKLATTAVSQRLQDVSISQCRKCHSVFGIMDLIQQEKPDHFMLSQVTSEYHDVALHVIKQYFLSEHVLVRARNMDISNDCALDEYLIGLLKQGNSLFAKAEDGTVAGLCVSFASSPVDPRNLRNYAFYRQDPNTKDFLYFTAKLQETPNLWDVFKQQKVYEIKMITVLPEFRRQGLAVFMAEKSKEQAHDQGYNVIRMDCINPYEPAWGASAGDLLFTLTGARYTLGTKIIVFELCTRSRVGALQGRELVSYASAIEHAEPLGYASMEEYVIRGSRYKIAERCMLQCLVKFPLHKVRGANAPFIKRSSEFNRCVRVYVDARAQPDVDRTTVRNRQQDLESLIE